MDFLFLLTFIQDNNNASVFNERNDKSLRKFHSPASIFVKLYTLFKKYFLDIRIDVFKKFMKLKLLKNKKLNIDKKKA